MTQTITHWIGGAPYEGQPTGTIPVENPATGRVEAQLLAASQADIDHAVAIADHGVTGAMCGRRLGNIAVGGGAGGKRNPSKVFEPGSRLQAGPDNL